MLNQIDLSRADLNLFVLFEAVLEQRHVGRAAERLNLTPSAVSHGLGRLRRLLNDPLFLRNPKGVVPTGRALELAEPIAEVLARARNVVATAAPFDPKTSTRRFTIGAPDGVSAVILPPLLADLRRRSPGIDIGLRQILPPRSLKPSTAGRIWDSAVTELDAHALDIAVVPGADVPPRFVARTLYEEEFVLAVRAGHPFRKKPTLDGFCRMQHLVVSLSGDPYGFVDDALARQARTRRVALTVPNFMLALSLVAQTDLIAALPKAFVTMHAARFGIALVKLPLKLDRSPIRAVAAKAALMDAGVAWLFDRLRDATDIRR
jgi:DNA-binding transcriptional LysR family regulator